MGPAQIRNRRLDYDAEVESGRETAMPLEHARRPERPRARLSAATTARWEVGGGRVQCQPNEPKTLRTHTHVL